MKKLKKLFIAGHIYDLDGMSIEEIQVDVRRNLQAWIECSDEDMIGVDLSLENNRFNFHLQRVYPSMPYSRFHSKTEEKDPSLFCRDSDFILGRRMPGAIKLSHVPFCVGCGYEYSFPVSEFISIYKDNCKALGIQPPKNIEVKATDSELEFSFRLPF